MPNNKHAAGTILIIEDDDDTREVLQEALEMEGYVVSAASDGAAGMRTLDETRPDLILLDVAMPTMDGETFLRLLRADARLKAIPVVVISGHLQTAHNLSCAAFIQKPVDLEALSSAVHRYAHAS